jgi:DNA processing protein
LENNGNIITEYNCFERVLPQNYLEQNRILCGLSKSLIIIEAGMTSGTMITAKYALEENREIYAVVGSLKSIKKMGTNFLIKQGANPIISALF